MKTSPRTAFPAPAVDAGAGFYSEGWSADRTGSLAVACLCSHHFLSPFRAPHKHLDSVTSRTRPGLPRAQRRRSESARLDSSRRVSDQVKPVAEPLTGGSEPALWQEAALGP